MFFDFICTIFDLGSCVTDQPITAFACCTVGLGCRMSRIPRLTTFLMLFLHRYDGGLSSENRYVFGGWT